MSGRRRQQILPVFTATAIAAGVGAAIAADPRLSDDPLTIRLFAEQPQIVTSIGLAIEGRDRICGLESHTHTPPPGYPGPNGDVVKVFTEGDDDGKADGAPLPFAEGITGSFKGPEIARYGVSATSLMPEGLEATMTVSGLRDLVAFLESRK